MYGLLTQYFLWYLWFLPIVGTTLSFPRRAEVGALIALWAGAQAVWLALAYRLEFMAQNTFVYLWLASLGLLFVHVVCVQRCLRAWVRWRHRQVVARQKAE